MSFLFGLFALLCGAVLTSQLASNALLGKLLGDSYVPAAVNIVGVRAVYSIYPISGGKIARSIIPGSRRFLFGVLAASDVQLGRAKATMLLPEGAPFLPPPHTITMYSRPLIS